MRGARVFSRLGRIADRYVITLTFAVLGCVNAQSWPYLAAFIAFGVLLDVRIVRPRAIVPYEMLSAEEIRAAKARWKGLIPLAVGLPLACLTFLLTTNALEAKAPELLQSMGPTAYSLASPFIGLLRNHYQDLLAHALPDRANVVAVTYTGLFLLFYCSLGFWLAKLRNIGAFDNLRTKTSSVKQKMAIGFCLVLFPILLVFSVYVLSGIDIDYLDESFGRRHINTNVAKYDSFFWHLAFMQGTFGMLVPVQHVFIRGVLMMLGLMKAGARAS
jgi:hypothetical protein